MLPCSVFASLSQNEHERREYFSNVAENGSHLTAQAIAETALPYSDDVSAIFESTYLRDIYDDLFRFDTSVLAM